MSGCYAHACRRLETCRTTKECEHVGWHLCSPPDDNPQSMPMWKCKTCQAKWFRNRDGVWHRD